MNRINKRMVAGAVVFVSALFLLPGVAAQSSVTVDATNTDTQMDPIKPEIDSEQIRLAWTYNFPTNIQALSGLYSSTPPATVNINCVDPINIIVSGPKTVGIPLDFVGQQGGTNYPFSALYQVSVTRELPGLKQFKCNYDVDVPSTFQDAVINPINGGGASDFIVVAAYYGLVQAKVAQQIKEAGPQTDVPFEINVENFGNARTTVQFSVDTRPEGSRWVEAVPDDLILSSPTNPLTATSSTAIFTVTTPYKTGWNNDQGTYRVMLNTFASDDSEDSPGPSLFTNMILRVRGVYVPGFEPVVMVGAVIGAAMVARMQREEDE